MGEWCGAQQFYSYRDVTAFGRPFEPRHGSMPVKQTGLGCFEVVVVVVVVVVFVVVGESRRGEVACTIAPHLSVKLPTPPPGLFFSHGISISTWC